MDSRLSPGPEEGVTERLPAMGQQRRLGEAARWKLAPPSVLRVREKTHAEAPTLRGGNALGAEEGLGSPASEPGLLSLLPRERSSPVVTSIKRCPTWHRWPARRERTSQSTSPRGARLGHAAAAATGEQGANLRATAGAGSPFLVGGSPV